MLHFLADISCDSWNAYVGSRILLSFGPESAARLRRSLAQLRSTPRATAFELEPASLGDFSVRQVLPPGKNGDLDELTDFFEEVGDSDDPVRVPDHLLAELLDLGEENDELKISRLPLFQQGVLECSVYLPNMFGGRACSLNGGIDLDRLDEGATAG